MGKLRSLELKVLNSTSKKVRRKMIGQKEGGVILKVILCLSQNLMRKYFLKIGETFFMIISKFLI